MFLPPFYNEHVKRIVLMFGTIFNNIHIVRREQDGDIINQVKVPISYGPKQKYTARNEERPSLDGVVKAITLPRLAYEMTSLNYDSSRKLNKFKTKSLASETDGSSKRVKLYSGVPYTLGFDLIALTNTRDDALQIMEQILPFFTPSFSVTINPVKSLGSDLKENVKIILNSVNINDEYEGGFEQLRRIETIFNFEVKMHFLRSVKEEGNVIKKALVNYNDFSTEDLIKSDLFAVDPESADKEDSYEITVTETFGYDD